jgi:uncharacterized protein YodC (DUF2158 family)
MSKFQSGDVVRLNSGSPDMTVSSAGKDGTYNLVWFSQIQKLETGQFPETCLTPVHVKEKDK